VGAIHRLVALFTTLIAEVARLHQVAETLELREQHLVARLFCDDNEYTKSKEE